jgi:hypothetical protein
VGNRHRWEVTNKVDFKVIGCEGMDWIHMVKIRVQWWAHVKIIMNPQVI